MEITKELEEQITDRVEELIDEADLWLYDDREGNGVPSELVTETADNVASYFDSSEDIPDWDIDWKKLYTEVTELVQTMLYNDEVSPENFSEEVLKLLKTY